MRVLFAEDDRQLRASVIRGLREASYTAEPAGTGTQALALATASTYDAIILDVLLPGMGGLEVCAEIRKRGSRVPILVLTALDAVEQRIAGLDAGADDYLVKPFDFGELLARLRALTRRGEEPQEHLVVGDLALDIAQQTAARGERDIPLTSREFALLRHLASNVDRVVSRADLVARVWDSSNSFSNVIDVYVSRLRRKLGEGDKAPALMTVRGRGFMLSAPDRGRAARAGRSESRRSARKRG